MSNRSIQSTLLPRPEGHLILVVLVFGVALGVGGLVLSEPAELVSLALLLVGAFGYNLLFLFLGRSRLPGWLIAWGGRLGNLVFLTWGVYLTGGFRSSFFSLYALFLVVGGLQHGWRGIGQSLSCCFLSWAVLAAIIPPADRQAWGQVVMLVGAYLAIALVVGAWASSHIRSFHESKQRNRELTFLREASRALGASLDPQDVLVTTLGQVNELLDVEAVSLALVDYATGRITFELAIGGGNESVEGLRMEPGQGIVGEVIQSGQSILVPDVSKDPRWFGGIDQISGYCTRCILCVPLRVKGQTMGALELLNKRGGPFTLEDQRLVSSLAGLAAQSLENARLHDEIRRHVEQLQQAYEEVRKLDELKSAFIRNVSHELRTPLALIEGYVELILDGQLGDLRPEQRQGLSMVAEKATLLSRLVNDIISLQTIGALGFDLEAFCLASLVRSVSEAARPRAEKARICLELELLCSEERLCVRGDVKRLNQVFAHLLDNAIKFSPNGGTVQVRLYREMDMIYVQVQDEGIGLPSDQWERVFERFYQVDGSYSRTYGGTGLGLALVREVVEAHGGGAWVESAGVPGQGSTFTVFLPAFGESPAA